MHSVLVFFPRCFNSTCYFGFKTNICYERVSVGESSAHTHTIYSLFSSAQTLLFSPRLMEHPSALFFFFNSKQVKRSHFHVKRPRALDPVSLLGTQGARCPFTHPVLPICQPSFNPPPLPQTSTPLTLRHRGPPAHSLPHWPHVTGKNLLHYQPIEKEASGGDKAHGVKKAGPKEKHL